MPHLTFLIDTNVFLALEADAADRPSEDWETATRFTQLVGGHGHRLVVHPATELDLTRCESQERREQRLVALRRYSVIPGRVPGYGRSERQLANDAVDDLLVEALRVEAASFLVTGDRRMRRRAARVYPDLDGRVITLAEAVAHLRELHPPPGEPPPRVEWRRCHELDPEDPIFISIREDYPEFDAWFSRCRQEHREAVVVPQEGSRKLAALCIVKPEDSGEFGLPPRRLKLCTLKVAEPARGQRLGELILKTMLLEGERRGSSGLWLSAFEHHVELLELLRDLGFQDRGEKTPAGELVLFRSLVPVADQELDAFTFNKQFGPRALRTDQPASVIPIRPEFEQRLFPELRDQQELLPVYLACGNGLRKAYLSHAADRQVGPGNLLLFYRSGDLQAVRAIGVCETAVVSRDPTFIAATVRTRTVYTGQEIAEKTENGTRDVLVLLFRQSRLLGDGWSLRQLTDAGVLNGPPQSIQRVKPKGARWVASRLAA